MEDTIIIASLISLAILFFIIYFAVKAGTSRLTRSMQLQNLMLAEYLKQKGIDQYKIREQLAEIKSLRSQKADGYIKQDELDEKLKEYFI